MQATLERLRERREERGDEGGFTLIELLIVIVILGILAAIVVFAVQNLTSQSAKASCGSDFKTVETALETYKAQVGHYPQVGDNAILGPGGAAVTLAAANPGNGGATGVNNGLNALYTTQTGVDGVANGVGPWLKDVPTNGSLYSFFASVGTNASPSVGAGVIGLTGTQANTAGTACA